MAKNYLSGWMGGAGWVGGWISLKYSQLSPQLELGLGLGLSLAKTVSVSLIRPYIFFQTLSL